MVGTTPADRQHELDLVWLAGHVSDLTYVMNTLGLAPDAESLEEQRGVVQHIKQRITRRFGYRLAKKIIGRVEDITGKLELPKEE